MASNTVEATLRSKFEDGVSRGLQQTQNVLNQALGNIRSAGNSASAAFNGAFESAIGGMERWHQQLHQTAEQSNSEFGRIGLFAAAMGIAVAAAFLKMTHAATEFVFDLIKESSAALEARIAFESLTKAQNEQASVVLGRLKQATEGQISGTLLMQNANRVMQSGVKISMEMYAKLAENVFLLAKSAGVDGAQGINTLTDAVIRGNARGLQSLGLHLAVKDAVSAMAEATGSSTTRLRDAGKMQAFYNELLEQSSQATAALGPRMMTLEDLLRQGEVTWKGYLSTLGQAIGRSGTLQGLLEQLSAKMLETKQGQEQLDQLTLSTNRFVISALTGMALVANGLSSTLQVANVFWGTIKIAFATGSSAVLAAVGGVTMAIEWMSATMDTLTPGDKFLHASYLKIEQINQTIKGAIEANVKSIRTAYDGALPETAKKLDGFARQLAEMAGNLSSTTDEILRGAGSHRTHGDAATADAEALKKANEQLAKYVELRRELMSRAGAGNEGRAALAQLAADWAKVDEQITLKGEEWDRRRNELKVAAVIAYQAKVADIQKKAADAQAKLDDQADQIAAESERKRIEQMQALGKAEIDYGQKREANERHFEEVAAEAARRREEERKKEVSDALATASAIQQTLDLAARGKLGASTGVTALGQVPQAIDALKAKLNELNSRPVLTEEQIGEVVRLQAAIERLNRINVRPFQKAMQTMREEMTQLQQRGTEAWAEFWSNLVQGQEGSGRKLLAAFIGLIGQMLVHIGVILIQSGIAEIALAQTLVGRMMGASVAGGLKAIAAGAIVAAVGGAMQGAAAGMAQSNEAAGSSSSGSSQEMGSAGPSNNTVQVINVGAPKGSPTAGEASEPKPQVIELRLSLDEGVAIQQVIRGVDANNQRLRLAIKKANG